MALRENLKKIVDDMREIFDDLDVPDACLDVVTALTTSIQDAVLAVAASDPEAVVNHLRNGVDKAVESLERLEGNEDGFDEDEEFDDEDYDEELDDDDDEEDDEDEDE